MQFNLLRTELTEEDFERYINGELTFDAFSLCEYDCDGKMHYRLNRGYTISLECDKCKRIPTEAFTKNFRKKYSITSKNKSLRHYFFNN